MQTSRRTVPWFLIGLLGLPLAAAGAWAYAASLMRSADAFRSPLRSAPPEPGSALGSRLSQRVLIVLVDALRDDISRDTDVMPFLNELRRSGASATMHSRPPSFSVPGWITILSGAWPDINDSQAFNPPGIDQVRPATQDNVFAAARRIGLHTAIAGYPWFRLIFPTGTTVEASFHPQDDVMSISDRDVAEAGLSWLDSGEYSLVLIHFDQVDDAGHHQGGPLSEAGKAAASRVDGLIQDLAASLDLEQDVVIVVSDHGHIDRGGLGAHGGAEAATLIEPFVMAGAGVRAGELGDIQMVDVAPTIAVLLGAAIPAVNQGHPLLEALQVPDLRAREIQAALTAQQGLLAQAYSAALGVWIAPLPAGDPVAITQAAMDAARLARLWRERLWRIPTAIILTLVPAAILWRRRDRKAGWLALLALLTLSAFYFRILFLDRDGYNYFFTTVEWRIELYLFVGVTMGVALMLGWVTCLLVFGAIQAGPRQAAGTVLGYTWLILYFLGAIVALNFAVNGALIGWTLPHFWTMFLALLALLQAGFTAACGLALAGLAAGLAWAVQRRTR